MEEEVAEEFAESVTDLESIERFVRAPTWREVLLEAVESEEMNLWEVDLVRVAAAYLKKIRELQSLDLRVPANVILASALLLHYKAQALKLEEEPEEVPEDSFHPLLQEEIPDLMYNENASRTRTVTLEELISAVEEVMREGKREIPRKIRAEPLNIDLPKEDMHSLMKKVYCKADELKDQESILLFSNLMREFNGHGESRAQLVTYSLIPVLHLVQDQKMLAWQDSLFGEIFLKVL